MAALTRVYQKIFGSTAPAGEIGKFGSLAAGTPVTTSDPTVMQALANWLSGWNSAVLEENAPALEDMNALGYVTTYQLAYMFQNGIPAWNAETTYYIGSLVRSGSVVYISKTSDNVNNDITDTAYWTRYSTDPVGTGKDFWGATLPNGYIWASGKTIGDATSGATERANADTEVLFTQFWTDFTDTTLPIFTSAGAGSTRGASAALDFAAHKRMSVPDKRGRVSAGKDDLGGSAAGRLTSTVTPSGATLGASGGEESHVLSTAELAAHDHGGGSHTHTIPNHSHAALTVQSGAAGAAQGFLYDATSGSTQIADKSTRTDGGGGATGTPSATVVNSNGSNTPHNNVQPAIVCNYIIKL